MSLDRLLEGPESPAELCGGLVVMLGGYVALQARLEPLALACFGLLLWDILLNDSKAAERVGKLLGCCTHPLDSEDLIHRLESD